MVKMAMLMQNGEEASVERLSAITAKDVREVQTQAVQDMLAYLAGRRSLLLHRFRPLPLKKLMMAKLQMVKPAQEAPIKRRGRKKKDCG